MREETLRFKNIELIDELNRKNSADKEILWELVINNKPLLLFIINRKFGISRFSHIEIPTDEFFHESVVDFYVELEKGINQLINKGCLENLKHYGFWTTFVYRKALAAVLRQFKIWEIDTPLLYLEESI